MTRVDLNCDLGEGFGRWELGEGDVMGSVTSVNVACGMHAGDPVVMRDTISRARTSRCAIGAHPGYPDLQGFGRRSMGLSADEVYCLVQYQVAALAGMCSAQGVRLSHVKPHGALYNTSARDEAAANAIAAAVRDLDKDLILVGLPGSEHERAAQAAGLAFAAEFFCDRGYRPDGSLVPRRQPGALVLEEDTAVRRTVRAVCDGLVEAVDGTVVTISADTLCLHGDGPHALSFARRIRAALEEAGVEVRRLGA